MKRYFEFVAIIIATMFISTSVFSQSSETLNRMMAANACNLYGENSDVCASAKRDIYRSGSSETLDRMMAVNACNLYGENSDVCASAKRDLARKLQGASSTGNRPQFGNESSNGIVNSQPLQYTKENNTITFSNQSGEPALVKVRGATNTQTFVSNGSSSTVNASGGTHYIVVRYGSSPPYTYSKGESFSVDETATQYSAITITLHKVAHGNYSSSSTSQAEFDSR